MIQDETDTTSDSEEYTPVEVLAEQYLERLRKGERPRISDYVDEHPQLAEEIRDVFRTLAMLEDLAPDHNEEDSTSVTMNVATPTSLGEYRIIRELGRGGMGVVYEAEHSTMRRRVALKILHTRATKSDHDLQRFLREARSAGRLHHTNIVPVFEVGTDQDIHFYAMQCIRGQNLDRVIADLRRLQQSEQATIEAAVTESASAAECLLSGQFEDAEQAELKETEVLNVENPTENDDLWQETIEPAAAAAVTSNTSELSTVGDGRESYFHRVARVGLQVADALAYAHEHGILHRDIKPANLILDTVGTVWVTDFGLARSEGDDLTHTGDIVGTLRYMAPERFRGEADARSDIYSLGLTLYELCTLRYAFDRADRGDLIRQVTREDVIQPRKINPLIPRDLETIILKCIDREPGSRYQKAALAADDLRLFLADRPVQARRITFMEQGWRWCRRNPGVAGMVCFIGVLLSVIFFGALKFAIDTTRLNDDLVTRKRQVDQAWKAERDAYAESRYNLYQSLYRQAQAERRNELTGRQDRCLEALQQAASLLSDLQLSENERREQRLLLRNEAVAALGQTGLRLARSRMPGTLETRSISYDDNYERYAISRGQIEVRRVGDNQLLKTIPQLQLRATDLIFSRDGRFVATIHRRNPSDPRYVRVWDLEEDKALLEVETPCTDICFSPQTVDGTPPHLAFLSGESSATVFRSCDPDQLVSHDFGFRLRGVSFIGQQKIGVVGDESEIAAWVAGDNTHESFTTSARARRIDWCEQQNRVAVGYQSGTIDVFELNEEFTHVAALHGHVDDVMNLSISADGELVASTAWDGTTRIWDIRSEREIKRLENDTLQTGFSRDSKFLCCEDSQRQIRVYEITRNQVKHSYFSDRSSSRNHAVDFHPVQPDLSALATGFHVELWDLNSDDLVQLVKSERTFVARFSEDGERMMTSGRRGLRIWNVTLPADRPWKSEIVSDARFLTDHDTYSADATPDLSRIAFVDVDGRAFVIDSKTPDERSELKTPSVSRVAISPDGRWVVTVSNSGRGLIVWNASTGEQVKEILPRAASMLVAFSQDGKWLAASNTSGRFLWRVGQWESEYHRTSPSATPGVVAASLDSSLFLMPRDRFSLEVLDGTTLRPLVALDTAGRRLAASARFSDDGEQLAISSQGHFEVWDIPKLRTSLDAVGLDWNATHSAVSGR